MAVSRLNFAAQVDDWVRQTERRMLAVFRESAQRLTSIAANGVPVDTGFARVSVLASLSEMPAIKPMARPDRRRSGQEAKGSLYSADFGQIVLTINNAQLGQTIHVGWTASYILMLEYGSSSQAPNGFVRIAAAQWQRIVGQVTAELKVRAAAR